MIEEGALTGQVINLYHNGFIHILIWLILLDIFSGIIKSFKVKKTSSSVGLLGLSKHIMVVFLITLMNIYLPLFGFGWYGDGFTLYMIVIYLISLTENWGDLGYPLPDGIKESLVKLKSSKEKLINLNVEHMDVKETKTIKGEDDNE